jgi:hypothetical protein
VKLLGRSGDNLLLRITDAGSGVDPRSLDATVDGVRRPVRWAAGRASIATGFLSPGLHRLVVAASDYQEAKNMEDVGPVLPNTRTLRTTFRVR